MNHPCIDEYTIMIKVIFYVKHVYFALKYPKTDQWAKQVKLML